MPPSAMDATQSKQSDLSIKLLGSCQIKLHGQPITSFATTKVQALLVYLAVEADRSHPRSALAHLLWPDQPNNVALHSLRQALVSLRRAIGDKEASPPFLHISRQTLQFNGESNYWLDTAVFTRLLEKNQADPVKRWSQAAALYQDDFLAGFYLDDNLPFDEWLQAHRESYRQNIVETLGQLAAHYESEGQYRQAVQYARQEIKIAPWQEEAHRRLMRCLALDGQRNAALAHYPVLRQTLTEEIAVTPSAETVALVEQIQAGNLSAGPTVPRVVPAPFSPAPAPLHNLPAQLTSFIGRETELSHLTQYLANPDCRLITLVGPGGTGKTRLALQVAEKSVPLFSDGVYFVPLASVHSSDLVVTSIGSALHIPFAGHDAPITQLLNYLRPKQMLLVLDNFEHLLAGVDLVIDLLRTAPDLKIMVTSREQLNLQAEWLLRVEGLTFPHLASTYSDSKISGPLTDNDQPSAVEKLEDFGAVRLFVQRVKQVNPKFNIAEEAKKDVVQLCQLAAGVPLVIELAAAQMERFSLVEILRNIQLNLDRLATTKRDIPARHRSLRALFDSSWEQLEPTEQILLQNLSIFWSGFELDAAEIVARATLLDLDVLVQKSMLRQTFTGRYEMHQLLRQYATEKLQESGKQYEAAQNRHCAYYATFLQQQEQYLVWGKQTTALTEIEVDIENIRAAWRWAIDNSKLAELEQAKEGMFRFYKLRNWLHEGAAVFKQAADLLAGVDKKEASIINLETNVLLNLAYFAEATQDYDRVMLAAEKVINNAVNLQDPVLETRGYLVWGRTLWYKGSHKAAREHLVKALMQARTTQNTYNQAQSLYYLSDLYWQRGDYAIAQTHIQQALALYRAEGRRQDEADSLNRLGAIYRSQGNYSTARDCLEQALQIYRSVDDRYREIGPLHNLGVIHLHLGLYSTAQRYIEQALEIAQAFGNRQAIARNLNYLGTIYWHLDNGEQAQEYCRQALTLSRDIGDRYSEGYSLNALADILAAMGNYKTAARYYRQALPLRRKIGQPALAMADLAGLAWVTMAQGDAQQALTQLDEVLAWLKITDDYLYELTQIYWVCYQTLKMAEAEHLHAANQAGEVRQAMHATLQEQAGCIENVELRRSYLDNVKIHQNIMAAFQSAC